MLRSAGASPLLGFGLFLTASTALLAQTTVWVDDVTCPSIGTGTVGNPYCQIQTAICVHQDDPNGVIVRVKPGTYNEAVLMVSNVQVISTDGPEVTFIDPTGKACMSTACAPSATQPCSAVIFPEAATGRLEGFTVHHGSGFLNCLNTCGQIGGGITVFAASPTITRNTIEDNMLMNVWPTYYFYGGGIYIEGQASAAAAPVITRNLIRNNTVNTQGGIGGYPTFGIGGAIFAGDNTSPIVRENTIEWNSAGNGSLNVIGVGGALAIYSGWQGTAAIIQKNMIRNNYAGHYGGGLYLGDSDPDYDLVRDPSRATIENNIIVENQANEGGGVYTATTVAMIKHNTIADNTAIVSGTTGGRGGGIRLGPPGPSTNFQATLVNNIIAFNQAIPGQAGGSNGGGVYVSTQGNVNPIVRYDDIYGNLPTNVAGS